MKVTIVIKGREAFPAGLPGTPGPTCETFANLRRVDMDRDLAIKTLRHIADDLERRRAR